jgi:hypothetical protein
LLLLTFPSLKGDSAIKQFNFALNKRRNLFVEIPIHVLSLIILQET